MLQLIIVSHGNNFYGSRNLFFTMMILFLFTYLREHKQLMSHHLYTIQYTTTKDGNNAAIQMLL